MLPELAGNTVLGWFVCLFFFEREVLSDAVRTIRLSFKISLSLILTKRKCRRSILHL